MEQEQTLVTEEKEVSEEFKQGVAQCEASGVFDQIVAEITKLVEEDKDFKKFVTEEEAQRQKQRETLEADKRVLI
jgi:hypothetical protein